MHSMVYLIQTMNTGESRHDAIDTHRRDGIGHQAIKFSPDGVELMRLGKAGVSGSGPDLFDQPNDLVVAPNGDIFVADSHRRGKNNRVLKFDKTGKFIKEWGHKGSDPGELLEPHAIAMDSQGRLFVGDCENNRIEIFDQDGKVLDEWRQFGRPSGSTLHATIPSTWRILPRLRPLQRRSSLVPRACGKSGTEPPRIHRPLKALTPWKTGGFSI
jgi:hypothetical protein